MNELIILSFSILAGFVGALLGLGGGIIIVPVLSLLFHVDIRYAIAASLISVIATSSGAAAGFLKDHLTNLRLAVLLEIGTVTGAITGFLIAYYLKSSYLYLLFGIFLLFSAVLMLRKREAASHTAVNHPWASKLSLNRGVDYQIDQLPLGIFLMYFAGILSAILGIGSGILKVPAMDAAMKLPMKVSSATSNFMIGVTASASAGAYLLKGDVRAEIAGPVAVGIIIGSSIGAKSLLKISSGLIRKCFVVVLSLVGIKMIFKGLVF